MSVQNQCEEIIALLCTGLNWTVLLGNANDIDFNAPTTRLFALSRGACKPKLTRALESLQISRERGRRRKGMCAFQEYVRKAKDRELRQTQCIGQFEAEWLRAELWNCVAFAVAFADSVVSAGRFPCPVLLIWLPLYTRSGTEYKQ